MTNEDRLTLVLSSLENASYHIRRLTMGQDENVLGEKIGGLISAAYELVSWLEDQNENHHR